MPQKSGRDAGRVALSEVVAERPLPDERVDVQIDDVVCVIDLQRLSRNPELGSAPIRLVQGRFSEAQTSRLTVTPCSVKGHSWGACPSPRV